MADSEDPDEMPHKGSSLFVKSNSIFRERNVIFLEIITSNPSIYKMDHPDLTVSNFMENDICLQRVKYLPLQKQSDRFAWSNSENPDQPAPVGAARSGFTQFAILNFFQF